MAQTRRYTYFKANIHTQYENCLTVIIRLSNNLKVSTCQIFNVDLSGLTKTIMDENIDTLFVIKRQTIPWRERNKELVFGITSSESKTNLCLLSSFSRIRYMDEDINLSDFWKPCILAIIKLFKMRYPHAKVEYVNYYNDIPNKSSHVNQNANK
jgi:hypothetical protein